MKIISVVAGILLAGMSALAEKPNIVIILADDLGYGDLGCYGGSIPIPNLDRMAAEGLRLTDFHSGGTVCSPSRAVLMSGKYQQRTGVDVVKAVRDGKWKLVAKPGYKTFELFDLESDVAEKNDLSATYPERTEDMTKQLQDWEQEMLTYLPYRTKSLEQK